MSNARFILGTSAAKLSSRNSGHSVANTTASLSANTASAELVIVTVESTGSGSGESLGANVLTTAPSAISRFRSSMGTDRLSASGDPLYANARTPNVLVEHAASIR